MSEYLIRGETLSAIGDEVRTLTGTQNTMSPSMMATNIGAANSEISSQSDLITQIVSVLSGKAAGGSGGSSGSDGDGNGFPANPTAGDTPILMPSTPFKGVSSETLSSSGLSITLSKKGTYRLKYGGAGNYSGGKVALYDGNSQISNSSKTLSEEASGAYSIDYTISDSGSHTITVYGQTENDRHPISVFGPVACINWNNGVN